MKYFINTCTNPWRNMAFDEWCLQNGPDEAVFYLWRNEPSVIVGYNQDVYTQVNLDYLKANGIKLARRVTGGGAVYHDLQNLNYSFVGPIGSVHPSLFVEALNKIGLNAALSGRNDIFVDGRKISGYARRIWKTRELVHGTLMYDVDIDTLTETLNVPERSKLAKKGVSSVRSRVANVKDYLPQYKGLDDVQAALQEFLAGEDGELAVSEDQARQVEELFKDKFSTHDWLYGRFE
jgi:lipoate-protein ligase A